jgi:hypothetical protein
MPSQRPAPSAATPVARNGGRRRARTKTQASARQGLSLARAAAAPHECARARTFAQRRLLAVAPRALAQAHHAAWPCAQRARQQLERGARASEENQKTKKSADDDDRSP